MILRPFEGIRILDCTHVLAGPFATYQLAVLGADVIKVEDPDEPDQSRELGADMALNEIRMGTGFLTQGSNKRSIALDLKTEAGREVLRRLVRDWADVLVENYRPGAFAALGLGYEALSKLKPKLVYASMTAYGQKGPRAAYTAYDVAIQATSGVMASTGTPESGPVKTGPSVIDYATGTMGAFALASALFQMLRTGKGQYVDMAMLDVALMLQATHVTDHLNSGHVPRPNGNRMRFAESCQYETKQGTLQLAASNRRQHRRFYSAIGEEQEAARFGLKDRYARFDEKQATIARKMKERTADEWEHFLEARQVPAARVRTLPEALRDPQLQHRAVLHRHEDVPGIGRALTVPVAAFKLAHGGPSIDRPPPRMGEHTEEVLRSAGYSAEEIAALREAGAIR